MDHASQLLSRLLRFSAATRLYRLEIAGQPEDRFLVEAWAAVESLHAVGATELIVLSLDTEVAARSLLGSLATLNSRLAEGGVCRSTGLIHEVAKLGGDGGFGRYRLRMAPWPWLLSQASTSRVWQDKTLIEVVEDVFREFPQHADWHWSADALAYLARVPPRSYTVQYRQTHLDFISRLLAGEGLSWRIEEHAPSPQGHRLVIFADSTARSAFPEDPTSAAHDGIRFQGARELDQQDGIQALAACRSLQAASCTLLSYDYRNKQAITASIPTHHDFGGRDAPRLESYDSAGPVTDDKDAADRHARLMMEAAEARNKRWLGRSTMRSLRAGARFTLRQGPLAGKEQEYAVLAVLSVGFNNLPADTQAALAELFGPLPILLEDAIHACLKVATVGEIQAPDRSLIDLARRMGHAKLFEAIRADIVWRPVLADGTGLTRRPHAMAQGSQSAIVVGYRGETEANGPDEICCDRLGRIRIRFHWQGRHEDAAATCWVRVGQRCAGPGMGMQFLPRIGQEVLVQFLDNDLERPIVLAALYNGRGEGGEPPTPGGEVKFSAKTQVFQSASDTAASGQGNLAGGHAPTWHGASADLDGHRNPAAQWGIRSKEFGGWGYNQLLFDDSDRRGRIQFKTTQAGSELNLGHMIHSADNYRGSFRGTGVELRTDAYGVMRAGRGLLFSSYRVEHHASHRDPAGDNMGQRAMVRQAARTRKTFDEAARTHRTARKLIHFEIACDDVNLGKLIGRSYNKLDLSRDGRTDVLFGEMYFLIPPGTRLYSKEPKRNQSPPDTETLQLSKEVLIVGLRYAEGDGAPAQRGDLLITTYRADGERIGQSLRLPEAEYLLYASANKISLAYPEGKRPAPSAVYELLRFGRIVGPDPLVPSDVPHWREIALPTGKGWVNLNGAGIRKYSDADFPPWQHWQLVREEEHSRSVDISGRGARSRPERRWAMRHRNGHNDVSSP